MLGSSPNDSEQPQNIFVLVANWTWISSPMTGSKLATGPLLEIDLLLQRVGRVQQLRLRERRARDLKADRKLRPSAVRFSEAGRNRDRGDARKRHRHSEVVGQVHRQRVLRFRPQLERDRRRG